MKRSTRTIWVAVFGLALLATGLVAATEIGDPQKLETDVPGDCSQFAGGPADARSEVLPWDQRLSLAACRQQFEIGAVSDPAQFPALISKIDHEMQPSMTIYSDALTRGPTPEIKILAANGLGMGNVTNIVRARKAVAIPDVTVTAGTGGETYGGAAMEESATQRERTAQAQRALEPLLAPWKTNAVAAFADVERLAKENPDLCQRSAVINFIVGNAQAQVRLLSGEEEAPAPASAQL